ncbi:sel1 repeat family protein [bacterium]|nr:sel1 repeat family protein [bacterium]
MLKLFLFILLTFSAQANSHRLELIKKLALKNVDWAQYELSNLYYEGELLKKNERKAFRLMLKSAQQGYDRASYALGVYYKLGIGCPISKIKAYAWMKKSYDFGYARAQQYLLDLEKDLDQESILIGQKLLKRQLRVNITPNWVYIKSHDQKIRSNSKGSSFLILESYLYSKKALHFSKVGYQDQSQVVEFGYDQQITIILKRVQEEGIEENSTSDIITEELPKEENSKEKNNEEKQNISTDWIYQ